MGSNEKVDIYSQYVRTVRLAHYREYSADINRKQKEYYTSLKGSPQHSKMNMLKRQRSKRTYAKWKAHQSTQLRLARGKTLKEEGCMNHLNRKVPNLKLLIKNGPFFICVKCNCCLYRTSVICFNIEKCNVDENIIFMVKSYDDNYYICMCDKALRKNSVSCQAVANRLNVVELPKLFQDICRHERLLVSKRILFKKVTVMPKGKSLKIKGSICIIPVSEVGVN